MTMMSFLATLPSEYDSVKAHILSSLEISSFQETFNRILRTEISSPTLPFAQMNSALVGRNIGESKKQQYRNSGPGGNSRGPISGGVICYYYRKTGHVMQDYKKRQSQNQRFSSAHVVATNEASD